MSCQGCSRRVLFSGQVFLSAPPDLHAWYVSLSAPSSTYILSSQMSASTSNHPKEPQRDSIVWIFSQNHLYFTLVPWSDFPGHKADLSILSSCSFSEDSCTGDQFCFYYENPDPNHLFYTALGALLCQDPTIWPQLSHVSLVSVNLLTVPSVLQIEYFLPQNSYVTNLIPKVFGVRL